MSTNPNYEIDYTDKRFAEVESDKNAALNNIDSTYDNMVNQSDKYYQEQINASKERADKQAQLQQEQTDFAIEQIEQQKEQTRKDYLKEQSGAYVDWQKQSNQYGANAEAMAAQGMDGTGYSESSQVSMYNAYQNRVTTARESYNQAVLNYNNSITEARLQNNSLLAEIAYNALQQQLELSLQGFQYKNQLILDKTAKRLEVDNMYHNRYLSVLDQINHENALAEQVRQYNESKLLEEAKLKEEQRQFDAQMEEEQRQFAILHGTQSAKILKGSSVSKGGGSSNAGKETKTVKAGTGKKTSVQAVDYDHGSSSNFPVDMKSVMALGFGPISAEKLAQLVSSGAVERYVSNGKLKFRNKVGHVGNTQRNTNALVGSRATAVSFDNRKG